MESIKRIDICGMGNVLVDLFVQVSNEEFAKLNLEKGTMRLATDEEQKTLLRACGGNSCHFASGGSVANSIIAIAQLGAKAAFLGRLGDDEYGRFFKKELDEFGIEFPVPLAQHKHTGTCLSIVSGDAERTMRTNLAVASELCAEHIKPSVIAASNWLFVEGYLASNGASGQSAIRYAIESAKEGNTRVALTCSESWVISAFREFWDTVIGDVDLIFANADEAKTLSNEESLEKAFEKLLKIVPNAVITDGPRGALVSYCGTTGIVSAFPCKPVDMTGAGDMFAGGFLYGVSHGVDPLLSARGACFLGSKVVSQFGARINSGLSEMWKSVILDPDLNENVTVDG